MTTTFKTAQTKPCQSQTLMALNLADHHQSSFQLISILLINPGSTWPWIIIFNDPVSTWTRFISIIERLVGRDLFNQSSFYLAMISLELFLQFSFYLAMNAEA